MSDDVTRLADAQAGMAFERALFEGSGAQVGLWTARVPAIVCPRAYEARAGFAAAMSRSATRGWPVVLRPTGGGAVPQGPGIDNLALAFDAARGVTIDDVYRLLVRVLTRAIDARLVAGDTPGSFCDGAWNLSCDGRKIVGTAQRWRPLKSGARRVLAHALILTRDTYHPGAEAVAALHVDLGLGAVVTAAQTSLEAAFGLQNVPADALRSAAQDAIRALE